MIGEREASAAALDAFYAELERDDLKGLWLDQGRPEPPSAVQPYVWQGTLLRRHLERAGALLHLDESDVRRALVLTNPGLKAERAAVRTLMAAVQMILPGETVITHRHTNSAIRFITHGRGALTTVQGEQVEMNEGDLLLTPNWTWHDHVSEADGPVIWMDGLDRPLVKFLDAVLFELFPGGGHQPVTRPRNYSARKYGAARLRPTHDRNGSLFSPQCAYTWAETFAALSHLAELGEASPYDDVAAEYQHPVSGGHVLPTIGCDIQLLRPGVRTRAHRHTSSAVYHVFRGRGCTVMNGRRFDWEEGDYVALPAWTWHEHANASPSEAAILFSINDVPVLESLGLYREEEYAADGGHQAEG
jgi:gentisate 1,2-dioxygenase